MSLRFSRIRRASRVALVSLVSTGALLAGSLSPASAAPSPSVVASPGKRSIAELTRAAREAVEHPTIKWTRCAPALQCGTLLVPLDYTDMTKGTFQVQLGRRVADNSATRVGALFVNPGGPGGSAIDSVSMFAEFLGPSMRRNFDLIAVEPRGVDWVEPALCSTKSPDPVVDQVAFPYTAKQQKEFFAQAAWARAACANKSRPRILDYMSTGSSARDLEQVRKAIREEKLNYYGVSYGSYLGATYANLFPDKVRAVAVDGVIDPVAWATGRGSEGTTVPVTERIKSGEGARQALLAAFSECERVGVELCPSAPRVRREYTTLTNRLRSGPITIPDPVDGEWTLAYDELTVVYLQAMYDHDGIPLILDSIDQLYGTVWTQAGVRAQSLGLKGHQARLAHEKVVAKAAAVKKRGIGMWQPSLEEDFGQEIQTSFWGVLCTDSINPQTNSAWVTRAAQLEKSAPGFGIAWLWSSGVCPGWPAKDRAVYRGPFTKTPANGLLIISSLFDPATPLTGAQALRELSPNSRLLTVQNMWGHSAVTGSTCAAEIRNHYLTTGELPAADATCEPDHPLFTRLN